MNTNQTLYYKPVQNKGTAALLILEPGNMRSFLLKGSMKMGRETQDNHPDIPMNSSIISREHGEFIYDDSDGSYYYIDTNSMNGTYYNGNRMMPYNERGTRAVKLSNTDILRIDGDVLGMPHKQAVLIIFSTQYDIHQKWQRFSFMDMRQPFVIGRNITKGFSLNDFMVSKQHAVMRPIGNGWTISDNNSTNGVIVNGRAIESEYVLRLYDVIRLGNTMLIYVGGGFVYNGGSSETGGTKAENRISIDINRVVVQNGLTRKVLLKDIHLQLQGGDFVLIMGGAGAGKTTFIKSVIGEMRAEGQIMLNGLNLYDNYKVMKDRIGIVPQFSTVRMNDTVYHTLYDAALTKMAGIYTRKEIKQRVEEIMDQLMLKEIRKSQVGVISGGQKKRVEVAIRSITKDQSMFILDEPDSGVDAAGRVEMMKDLKACADSGSIVSVITHMPNDAQHLFTKIIVLAKSKKDGSGHLAFFGTIPEALRFFGVQNLQDIVMEINAEGGKGRADEFIEKFERMRR